MAVAAAAGGDLYPAFRDAIFLDIGLFITVEANADAVAEHLLSQALVAVVPGSGFGVPQNLRLSYACSMENIEGGIERIAAAAGKLTG